MKHARLSFEKGFTTAIGNARAQLSVMVIEPGGKEGGPDNRHVGADQWLIVLEGAGQAIVEGRTIALDAGSVVLIEAGERHEIKAGAATMKTINVFVPPAFDDDGEALPAGRSN